MPLLHLLMRAWACRWLPMQAATAGAAVLLLLLLLLLILGLGLLALRLLLGSF